MNFDIKKLEWTREPDSYAIADNRIELTTKPFTDLVQNKYSNNYTLRSRNSMLTSVLQFSRIRI